MAVTDTEVNPAEHNRYLDIIIHHADPLRDAMVSMAAAAGKAARSREASHLTDAERSMWAVFNEANAFLESLSGTPCPMYLRGADSEIQDALKLLMDGGRRGAEAAREGRADQLPVAAQEMETFSRDMVASAARVLDWRSGAARP